MKRLEPIDVQEHVIDIYRDWPVSTRKTRPGPHGEHRPVA